MAKSSYKLSRELFGHTGDVRAVAVAADGSIVSASRDKTAILWKFQDGNYVGNVVMTGHSNFVCSVCVINPTQRHPNGLIVTGSNDNHLCIYNPGETQPVHKVKAHANAVCSLTASKVDPHSFLSSSWDITAKLWSLENLDKPQMTFLGHAAAVWCVADLPSGSVVTGSADKSVIVYLSNGKVLHKLKGHTDCVRDVAVIKDNEFLTCANDAIIKHWSAVTGDCLGNYYGHTNFIYSISAMNEGILAVSSGEDKTVRVWSNGEVDQTIELPAQSIWSVRLLPNEDIVCGASDGLVRIFSANPDRYADAEMLQKFEEAVENARASADGQMGDLNTDKIPGPEGLLQPGKEDGQTRLIKEGGSVKAYSWSQKDLKWNLIGDVTGGSSSASKQMLNGMEYDYVFSIDIQDGVPPLKLPYNKGDDPWLTAQKFIDQNSLSQYYLEQIANFIIKNSTPAPVVNSNPNQFYDPFTGGNRYIPSTQTQPNSAPANSNATVTSSSSSIVTSSYIPMKTYLKLEQANLNVIKAKLREFNLKPEVQSIPEDMLDLVVSLSTSSNKDAVAAGMADILTSMLEWPDTTVFPVLDLSRLAVLQKNVNEQICTDALVNLLKRHLTKEALVANQMLSYRLLANMMCHETGERVCLRHTNDILTALKNMPTLGVKNNQVAVSTYLLNLVVALNKTQDSVAKAQVFRIICNNLLGLFKELEAVFRVLVAFGTLLHSTAGAERHELVKLARESENVLNVLQTVSENTSDSSAAGSDSSKLASVSKTIIDLIV